LITLWQSGVGTASGAGRLRPFPRQEPQTPPPNNSALWATSPCSVARYPPMALPWRWSSVQESAERPGSPIHLADS